MNSKMLWNIKKREGIVISKKIVCKIVQEEELIVKCRKRKKYNYYSNCVREQNKISQVQIKNDTP